MRRRGLTAAGAVALVLLAGCAGPAATPDAPSALPAGVTVELVQLRSDVAARQAQVQIRNGSDDDLTIGALAVTDPRFADAAARVLDRDSVVRAGGAVNIRIQLPPMDCAAPDEGESAVQFAYTVGSGAAGGDGEGGSEGPIEVEAPIDDPLDVLTPLHERECRADAVADAAALSLASFTPSPPGEPADLVLEIVPTGEAAADVIGIHTTNLLTFGDAPGDTADTFPIDVAIGAGATRTPTSVHLPLVPLRCDPHAVQEDKRGTIFTLEVRVGGELGEIELAASEDMRGSILTWVSNWCGFGSG